MAQQLSFDQLPEAVGTLLQKFDRLESLLQSFTEAGQNQQADKLLSIDEAATFLNIKKATIYSKVSRRELPYMKQGKRLYFSKVELLDYLKSGRKRTAQEIADNADQFMKPNRG